MQDGVPGRVADPDPGSGAFFTPGSGMEINRIRDNIHDPQHWIIANDFWPGVDGQLGVTLDNSAVKQTKKENTDYLWL